MILRKRRTGARIPNSPVTIKIAKTGLGRQCALANRCCIIQAVHSRVRVVVSSKRREEEGEAKRNKKEREKEKDRQVQPPRSVRFGICVLGGKLR